MICLTRLLLFPLSPGREGLGPVCISLVFMVSRVFQAVCSTDA